MSRRRKLFARRLDLAGAPMFRRGRLFVQTGACTRTSGSRNVNKLNVKALAVGGGALWGFYMLFIGWAALFGWGKTFVETMSSVYIGFTPTVLGGVIGAAWGFADGAIAGAIIAIVYNAVARQK
jgi:hypothetical protein